MKASRICVAGVVASALKHMPRGKCRHNESKPRSANYTL